MFCPRSFTLRLHRLSLKLLQEGAEMHPPANLVGYG